MRYREIVFVDHEESDDGNGGIVQDAALRILHHKTDDSVVWECPTQESVEAAVDYLAQWDDGESRESSIEDSTGQGDEIIVHYRGDVTYRLFYNVGLSYIGLEELLSEMWRVRIDCPTKSPER